MSFPPREILDVLVDLCRNAYALWQPLVAAIFLKLLTRRFMAAWVMRGMRQMHYWRSAFWWRGYQIVEAIDWTATWVLASVIFLIVTTAVSY